MARTLRVDLRIAQRGRVGAGTIRTHPAREGSLQSWATTSAKGDQTVRFVKFTEDNDHEGEVWTFWLQVEGNEEAFDQLTDLVRREAEAQGSPGPYALHADVVIDEHDVDVLVEHGGEGYMAYHTKVTGSASFPGSLLADTGYGLTLEGLYKGDIVKCFRPDSAR